MLLRLLGAFALVLLLDLVLLVALAGRLGAGPTLALVLATAIGGAWLARREGLRAWRALATGMARGIPPADALVDGLVVFAAGLLLVMPGVLTDLLGLAGLAPPTRRLVRRALGRWLARHAVPAAYAMPVPAADTQPADVEDADVLHETRAPRAAHNVASARL